MHELLKNTSAYKCLLGDKQSGKLSHAYLISCSDKKYLRNYLKYFAKLIVCQDGNPCENCRICRLIDKEIHQDVTFYPASGEKLKVATADEIIDKSIIKPFELDKRVFAVCGFEDFDKSQNKLLKTLEEPPEGVILLLGSSNVSALLPTVKSRVKKLEVPTFSSESLFAFLKDKYEDKERLKRAIALSGGLLGEIDDNYNSNEVQSINDKALDVLLKMNMSREVAFFAFQLKDVDVKVFISVLKLMFGDLERSKNGGIAQLLTKNSIDELLAKFPNGAICEIIEKLNKLELTQRFNANRSMTIDKMLFTILEAKYKWQKL